jgi:hypothetical protein
MIRVWIVPKSTPNADATAHSIEVDVPNETRFSDAVDVLMPHVPDGYYIVKIERNGDYESKGRANGS